MRFYVGSFVTVGNRGRCLAVVLVGGSIASSWVASVAEKPEKYWSRSAQAEADTTNDVFDYEDANSRYGEARENDYYRRD